VQFKDDIRDKIKEQCIKDSDAHEIMQFIYDYERLTLLKDDLTKRKRVKKFYSLEPIVAMQSVQMGNSVLAEEKQIVNFAEHIQKARHMD